MDDPPERYNICPSCGTEFGLHDAVRTHEEIRNVWIAGGMKWWSKFDSAPIGWSALAQMYGNSTVQMQFITNSTFLSNDLLVSANSNPPQYINFRRRHRSAVHSNNASPGYEALYVGPLVAGRD
jgi:hypothetical protein